MHTGRATQRHRVALLALLARSPDAGVPRDALMAHLWPESDLERARNLLNVSVYVLRQVLGERAILSLGNSLRLATDTVEVDVVAFESALERGDREGAVNAYRGPFLDGFSLPDSPEFSHWLDRERGRLSHSYARALEALAEEAERRGDLSSAIDRWTELSSWDPYDSRIALRLMTALAASGNGGGALRHAEAHERLLREELEIETSPQVMELVARLRLDPSGRWLPGSPRLDLADHDKPGGQIRAAGPSAPAESEPANPFVATGRREDTRRALRGWIVLSLVPLATAVVILAGNLVGRGRAPEVATSATVTRPLPTTNPAAWELYRRASQPEVLRSDAGARQALALLQRAVQLDPSFAGAHAALARLHLRVGLDVEPRMGRRDRLDRARRHAGRAVALDRSSAEAYGTLGLTEMLSYDLAASETHLRHGLEIDPGNARVREWLVDLLIRAGRFGEALQEAERSLREDPLSPTARAEVARALVANGRCEEALKQVEALAELTPPLLRLGSIAARCYALVGSWPEAVKATGAGVGRSRKAEAVHAYYLARSGSTTAAAETLQDFLAIAEQTGEDAFDVATILAGLGRTDEAFLWLERSVDDYSFTSDVVEPAVAELGDDPRFARLLERAGLRNP